MKFIKGHPAWNKGMKFAIGHEKTCPVCGKVFLVPSHRLKQIFCSQVCHGQYKRGNKNPSFGKKPSEESRQKQRIKMTGKFRGTDNPNWKGGKIIQRCPVCNSEFLSYRSEHKITCSLRCGHRHRSSIMVGPVHPNWRGGITPTVSKRLNTRNWHQIRDAVRKRDRHECAICHKKNTRLNVHHIIPFDLSHYNGQENLITLCHSCHGKEEVLFYRENHEYAMELRQWWLITQAHPELIDAQQGELFP